MKISQNTVSLLQSFSQISANLLMKPGSKIAIRNGPVNSIQARAVVEENFPVSFAIYDLNQFLSLLSISQDPDIEFGEKSMTIKSDNGEIEYFYADPTLISAPSENSPQMEDIFTFDMSPTDITTIVKTASIVSATMMSIEAKNGVVTLSINDPKNNTSHSFRKVLGNTDLTFNVKMSIDSFKVVPDSYKVHIANAIAKTGKVLVFFFESNTKSLTYLIAADTTSKV